MWGHDGGAGSWLSYEKDSPYGDGGRIPPSFFFMGVSLAPKKKKKGPEPLGDEARVLCHSQVKGEQHVQSLLAGDLHVVHPPSKGICSLLPLRMLNDEVEVSLVERLSEAALGTERASG